METSANEDRWLVGFWNKRQSLGRPVWGDIGASPRTSLYGGTAPQLHNYLSGPLQKNALDSLEPSCPEVSGWILQDLSPPDTHWGLASEVILKAIGKVTSSLQDGTTLWFDRWCWDPLTPRTRLRTGFPETASCLPSSLFLRPFLSPCDGFVVSSQNS